MQQSRSDRTLGSSNGGISFLDHSIHLYKCTVRRSFGRRWCPVAAHSCGRTQGIIAMIQKLQDSRAVLLGAVAIFALGLTTSGYALGDGLRRAKMAEHRSVTVRGVSERNVTADLATWSISFSQQGSDLAPVQQSLDQQALGVRS